MTEEYSIINWNFVLPKNCNPVDLFLVPLTHQLSNLKKNEKLHIILDARNVNSIGLQNKMKMDWGRDLRARPTRVGSTMDRLFFPRHREWIQRFRYQG